MPALSQYANVNSTALAVLEEKGYQVWYEKETELYYAEKDGWDFAADDPCGLLGVVAIYEFKRPRQYSEYWWRHGSAADTKSVPTKPRRRYKSVVAR